MNDIRVAFADLAGLPGMPQTHPAICKLAKRKNWPLYPRAGRGGGSEVPISVLPPETQAALALRGQSQVIVAAADDPSETTNKAMLKAAHVRFELATDEHRQIALRRAQALRAVMALNDGGMPLMQARAEVAAQMQREGVKGGSVQSLCRWAAAIQGLSSVDWVPVLLPNWKGGNNEKEIPAQVWDWYKGHYLSRARPSHASTYAHVKAMADEQGWVIPSGRTFRRRFEAEVPRTTVVIRRDGPEAARRLLPRQARDALVFGAGEAVNGDGMKFDRLWVRFDDGEIINTATAWFWQDIRTRRILAWRLGKTESTDLFRLATYDLTAICAPEHYWMDNTRVAANKQMTAGAKGRHRFKNADDGQGLLLMIGGTPHFTGVDADTRNPGAKPIERAFGIGGLHEEVATHPEMIGKGFSREKAIPEALLRQVIAEEVARHNAKKNRRTQACGGLYSFDDAWEMAVAKNPPRVLSDNQRRLLLMAREVVKISAESGRITINAGRRGVARNAYWSEHLPQLTGQKVAVHYDPDNLHSGAHIYSLDGKYLCFADYMPGAAFNNTEAARENHKFQKRIAKAQRTIAENETRMDALARAQLYKAARPAPAAPEPAAPKGNVVRGVFQRHPQPERDALRATGTDGLDPDIEKQNRVIDMAFEAEMRRRIEESGWTPPSE